MFKTTAEVITQDFALWAIPNRDAEPGALPFKYELYGSSPRSHWMNGAIFISMATVTCTVPEGFDLMTKAYETLDQRQKEAKELYDDTMESIAADRKRLYLLDAPAAPEQGVDLGDGAELLPPDEEVITIDLSRTQGGEPDWVNQVLDNTTNEED
jgi:hypothetical protein